MEKVLIEKQVWESTLHRSIVLQAENERLKELLKLNNSLNKGAKAIYARLKEDTAGEQNAKSVARNSNSASGKTHTSY